MKSTMTNERLNALVLLDVVANFFKSINTGDTLINDFTTTKVQRKKTVWKSYIVNAEFRFVKNAVVLLILKLLNAGDNTGRNRFITCVKKKKFVWFDNIKVAFKGALTVRFHPNPSTECEWISYNKFHSNFETVVSRISNTIYSYIYTNPSSLLDFWLRPWFRRINYVRSVARVFPRYRNGILKPRGQFSRAKPVGWLAAAITV